jgi:hypothetical protein
MTMPMAQPQPRFQGPLAPAVLPEVKSLTQVWGRFGTPLNQITKWKRPLVKLAAAFDGCAQEPDVDRPE